MENRTTHFITGASGFIGRYIVRKLHNKGDEIFILLRGDAQKRAKEIFPDLCDSPRLRAVGGDVTKHNLGLSQADIEAIKSRDVYFWHFAANLTFLPARKKEAFKDNVEGAKNVVSFANTYASHYLHMSTIYVSGDYGKTFYEDQLELGQKFRNNYEYAKFLAEKEVRKNIKIPFLVFRTSIVIGDMYEGKAEGCTFGYYRYSYMLYVFREWLKDLYAKKGVRGGIVRILGTKYKGGALSTPWLYMPFPKHSYVDMIPVDYATDAMIQISESEKSWGLGTFHISQDVAPESFFVLKSSFEDLNLQDIKYVKVSPMAFGLIMKFGYWFLFWLRKYIKSSLWYVPYVTRKQEFDQKNTKIVGVKAAPQISREFLKRINKYAEDEVFATIKADD